MLVFEATKSSSQRRPERPEAHDDFDFEEVGADNVVSVGLGVDGASASPSVPKSAPHMSIVAVWLGSRRLDT